MRSKGRGRQQQTELREGGYVGAEHVSEPPPWPKSKEQGLREPEHGSPPQSPQPRQSARLPEPPAGRSLKIENLSLWKS